MKYLLLAVLLVGSNLYAQETEAPASDLEQELNNLSLPSNMAPAAVTKEKMYSYQNRLLDLTSRHEFELKVAKNFSPDDHLSSNRVGLNYRYHFNSKWNAFAGGFKSFNELNNSGKNLLYEKGLVPASDYQKAGAIVGVNFHTFYGKFRFGLEKAHYFDHYIGAGVGNISLKSGSYMMGQLETGLVFWLNKWGSIRVGVKDEIHTENRGSGKRLNQNIVGNLSFGMIFGGSSI